MKMRPSEDKECSMLCSDEGQHKYPYGLCLSLDDESLKKLGLDNAIPPGTIVKIQATAIVERASESLDLKGKETYASMQITHLGLEPEGTATDAATRLYSKPKE
jgi:methionine aminopeptidase